MERTTRFVAYTGIGIALFVVLTMWENGRSKPALPQLAKLADVFKIPVDDLPGLMEERSQQITKIVITGGPCAGKTTAMSWIQKEFEKQGYRVLFVPETASFLGEPQPMEIERKYLIRYPDLLSLEEKPNCSKVDMIQTYLLARADGTEVRVRQRGQNGNFICYKTEKRRISDITRVEVDRRIDIKEYVSLLAEADPARRPVRGHFLFRVKRIGRTESEENTAWREAVFTHAAFVLFPDLVIRGSFHTGASVGVITAHQAEPVPVFLQHAGNVVCRLNGGPCARPDEVAEGTRLRGLRCLRSGAQASS